MVDSSSELSLQALSSVPANSHCVECQSRNPTTLLCDFGVFICQSCLESVVQIVPGVRCKQLSEEMTDAFDLEIAKTGGNTRFRTFFADTTDIAQRYSGSKGDFYQRTLHSEVNSLRLLEIPAKEAEEEPSGVTKKISQLMGWLEQKLAPIVEEMNERVENSEVLKKVEGWVETGYGLYEAQVHEHIESKSGVLHPIKSGVDSISKALGAPTGESEIEMLELLPKSAEDHSEKPSETQQETMK